jgi:uncharacterized protein (TIGR00369 family)
MDTENTRLRWENEEATVRQRIEAAGAQAGVSTPEQITGKTGLEIMQSLLRGELPFPPISETLGFFLIEVGDGHAVFQGTPQFKHYNPLGTVHGGWYATLLDSALGCAVQTKLPAGTGYTTAELGLNIVRAANERSGPLRAIGKVIHSGRQMATAEARIVGPDGKLYAHATTTCFIFDAARAGR